MIFASSLLNSKEEENGHNREEPKQPVGRLSRPSPISNFSGRDGRSPWLCRFQVVRTSNQIMAMPNPSTNPQGPY